MATYTIEIPDGQGAQVVEAVCATYGYTGHNADPVNPAHTLTPNEFSQQQIVEWLYGVVEDYQGRQASATARAAAVAAVRANIQITRVASS